MSFSLCLIRLRGKKMTSGKMQLDNVDERIVIGIFCNLSVSRSLYRSIIFAQIELSFSEKLTWIELGCSVIFGEKKKKTAYKSHEVIKERNVFKHKTHSAFNCLTQSLLWRCARHPWMNMFHAPSATSCNTFSTCQLPWASSPPGTLLPLNERGGGGGGRIFRTCALCVCVQQTESLLSCN